MKKLFVLSLVVVLSLAATMAMAWTENFDSYTSGTTPYGDWVFNAGVWSPLTGGQAHSGAQSYHIAGATTSRIGRNLDFKASDATSIVLEGWFYDSNGATGSKRSWLGLQNEFAVSNSLARIGMNNVAQYQFHYYNGALVQLNTGLNNETGWHYTKLAFNKVSATDWKIDWQINAVNGTPYTGTVTYAWDAANASKVVLGYNYSTTASVDWDDINVSGVVPEPSSLLALATGLVGLGGVIRRRKA